MGYIINMNRIYIFISLMVYLGLSSLTAQSNQILDDFIAADTADAGTSFLLIAQATGQLDDSSTADDGLLWALQQPWGKKLKNVKSSDPVTTGAFHLALFQSFSIKGGIGYSLFKTPRYAAKEAGYQGFVTGTAYVNHRMTPDEVLDSLSTALDMTEEEE